MPVIIQRFSSAENAHQLIMSRLGWAVYSCWAFVCVSYPSEITNMETTVRIAAVLLNEICKRHNQCFSASSEISDFTPCTHAQSSILHIEYAEKTDD